MKKTACHSRHSLLGARMTEFAGFEMPLEYSGIKIEHEAVRKKAGLFDVSHMGEIKVSGKNSLKFIQHVSSNNASLLEPGNAHYSCLTNERGGIVDDMIVYKLTTDEYLLVVNASNINKDWEWLSVQNRNYNAILENHSDKISQFALQGPNAVQILQKLTDADLNKIQSFRFIITEIQGIPNVIISATGYTGAGGFELYLLNEYAESLWDMIMVAGSELGIKPIGLAARDILRMEMGYCLYGNDINDYTSPLEAGLNWITSLDEEKNLIGRDVLLEQKKNGIKKRLIGFKLRSLGIPRQHYEIYNNSDVLIGDVTSGTMSPVLNKGIGMGYVQTGYSKPGTEIHLKIRSKKIEGTICKFPFI